MRNSLTHITLWFGAFLCCFLIGAGAFYFLTLNGKHQNSANYKPPYITRPHGPNIAKEPGALPNDWMGHQRTYPHGRIKQNHYLNALRDAQRLHKNSDHRDLEWELLGPTNIGGRITDMANHPD